jgi:anti-anti-sigma factor
VTGDYRLPRPPLRATAMDETTVILAVAGALDMGTVGPLRAAIAGILRLPGIRRVVLDLAEVSFLGACGVSALVAAHRAATDRLVSLVVINCQRMPLVVLQITGVDKLLMYGDAQL